MALPVKKRYYYPGLSQKLNDALVSKTCLHPIETFETVIVNLLASSFSSPFVFYMDFVLFQRPCEHSCLEVKIEYSYYPKPYLYRDCGYELLKNAPCRDCKPGVADADFGFVVVNKTTYDFDRNGWKWTFTFCAADDCMHYFRSNAGAIPQKDSEADDDSDGFVSNRMILVSVIIAVLVFTCCTMKAICNCVAKRSALRSPSFTREVTMEWVNNNNPTGPSESIALLQQGKKKVSFCLPSQETETVESVKDIDIDRDNVTTQKASSSPSSSSHSNSEPSHSHDKNPEEEQASSNSNPVNTDNKLESNASDDNIDKAVSVTPAEHPLVDE
ncbi:unnamed protein product [Heligmosomoides polygyrus]|uniref:Expressed conserved protein n=1 Tax=Heligmosomoides polygyrus TaxID=6339 RepID=A0A3P7XK03_HELPZ|nr:unnamed protein product [Heligmosomoides polygyrus]